MFDLFLQILYRTSNIHIEAYSPLLDEIVHRWMIIVGCLPHDFNIRYPYWGILPLLLGKIMFRQRYIDG